jgi:hypothetical protein
MMPCRIIVPRLHPQALERMLGRDRSTQLAIFCAR